MATIYKICERAGVARGRADGAFRGSDVDLRDGFIHFSTAAQARRDGGEAFCRNSPDLMLVAVDGDALGPALKWERRAAASCFRISTPRCR